MVKKPLFAPKNKGGRPKKRVSPMKKIRPTSIGKTFTGSERARGAAETYVALHPNTSIRDLAATMGISRSLVHLYRRRAAEAAKKAPRRAPRGAKEVLKRAETPDRTTEIIKTELDGTPEEEDVNLRNVAFAAGVSPETVRKRMRGLGWAWSQDRRIPNNTKGDAWRAARLSFAALGDPLRKLSPEDIVFSDEKIFRAQSALCKTWRRVKGVGGHAGRRLVPRERWVCGVHVFGLLGFGWSRVFAFPPKGKGSRGGVNVDTFLETLSPHKPAVRSLLQGKFIILDGASIHKADRTIQWFESVGCVIVPLWPAHSPDLNPIENLWALMSRAVRRDIGDYWKITEENRAVMWRAVLAANRRVTAETKKNLCASFFPRLDAVLANGGDYVNK